MPPRYYAPFVLGCVLFAGHHTVEIPPWADPALPVRGGMALWLDAARLVQSHALEKQPPLKDGSAVPVWFDGSGHGHHVRQADANKQPKLVCVGDAWVVRFDGVDDHLRTVDVGEKLSAFTVFIVAAPHANPGDFRGFMALNKKNGRDYETGFTIDMNWPFTATFDNLNVEGKGFGGAVNVAKASMPFGELHVVDVMASPVDRQVRVTIDGQPAGTRPFNPGELGMEEITIGARYYTNGPGAQEVRGFLKGDIAEVILYDRVLSPEEATKVRSYLEAKHKALKEALPHLLELAGVRGEPVEVVANPPPVQMLVPGFTVRELPVALTNVNNLRYRPDGKLMALAYNGNIYLLSDTDGDGLEDKVELFWNGEGKLIAPIGMALTPPGYAKGQGVFVASKGKVSLIVDKDGDDKADEEIIVAQGWKELPHGVDALGVTLDKENNVYFGLGAANYANGYLLDNDGKAHYDLKSDRGTIQKVSADFKKRETVCTGIRFSVGMAFNERGDLFCTDQEGATWLPNGNPLDELLHVVSGRHYGFPPRHPKHLPNVIDEPSVFDYGPQHQSTCGLLFNNAAKPFGPKEWHGDAIICGESRGKLYRTKLTHTPNGYLGQTQLIACLNALTIDACLSPQGDLVVCTHSGPPDWGTGPNGKGKLYKISYADHEVPQPLAIHPTSPQELRIDFDRPLNPEQLHDLAKQTKITYGQYVRAGDRFEVLKPPYQAVQMQTMSPRFNLPVYGASLTNDGRTLLLQTAPMRHAVHYGIKLPGMGRPPFDAKLPRGQLPQHPEIDLNFTLNGLISSEKEASGRANQRWLAHLGHASQPGKLEFKLDLRNMLRPAVQPGSQLDHKPPQEVVHVKLECRRRFTFGVLAGQPAVSLETSFTPKSDELIPVQLRLWDDVSTNANIPEALTCTWWTDEDPRPRPLAYHRILLPWAELPKANLMPSDRLVQQRDIPELAGGNWGRGRRLFFSEDAACAKCHAIRGEGAQIGPDLANLVHRDYASVRRDIEEPSYAINPDHVTYLLRLHDGRVLTGAVRTEGDKLHVGNEKGEVTTIVKNEVEQMKISPKSIMPEDLHKKLGPERMKDLLTFLLNEPPHMPLDAPLDPPPPRKRAEVNAILAGAPKTPANTRPLHVVLVAGPKDHGPGEHDYPAWQKRWEQLLPATADVTVTTAWEWPKPEDFARADVLVFFQHGTWNKDRARHIDSFLEKGGGLLYLHWAVDGSPDAPSFAQRIGLAARGGMIGFRHGPVDLGFEPSNRHPIARNFTKIHFHDESYWKLVGDPKHINLLATSIEDGQPQPQFWTMEPSNGRVFVCILGHYSWTFDDPLFRVLILRGMAWSAKEPVDRFNDLVWHGARVED